MLPPPSEAHGRKSLLGNIELPEIQTQYNPLNSFQPLSLLQSKGVRGTLTANSEAAEERLTTGNKMDKYTLSSCVSYGHV